MRGKKRIWVLAAALSMVVPAYLAVGTSTATAASLGFPDDDPVDPMDDPNVNVDPNTGGSQTVHIKVGRQCRNVRATGIPLLGPEKGKAVGLDTINALCTAALGVGYGCNGVVDGAGCGGPGCCTATNPDATQRITCEQPCLGGALGGFTITRIGGSEHFTVVASFGGEVRDVTCSTNAGNPHETDLLPRFLIGLDRQGTDGVFTAYFATATVVVDPNDVPVPDPNSIVSVSVDSSDPNVVDPNAPLPEQDRQLHQALADGIVGLGLGLNVQCTPGYGAQSLSPSPGLFGGTVLDITNISEVGVQVVGLSAPEGAVVTGATTSYGEEVIPTLSEWGLILLVAVLFLTGLWMLRRRRLGEAA